MSKVSPNSAKNNFDVYWIDDCTGQILSIARGAMAVLWDNRFSSCVYLFGDDSQPLGATQRPGLNNEANLNKSLTQIFRETCSRIDAREWLPNGETYRNNQDLIRPNEEGLGKIGHIVLLDDSQTEGQPAPTISTIMGNWSNNDLLEKLKNCTQDTVDQRLEECQLKIDDLFNFIKIDPGKVVALDVCLLQGDYSRIIDKSLPAISMAIYYWCKKHGMKCYVYSHFSYEDNLVKNWHTIYNKIFDTDRSNAIDIHPENCLVEMDEHEKHIMALLDMIKENSKNGQRDIEKEA